MTTARDSDSKGVRVQQRPGSVATSKRYGVGTRVILAVLMVTAPLGAQDRPRLEVAAASCSCPGVTGSFVALLDPERGMLLLSGAPFPGGSKVSTTTGQEGAVAMLVVPGGGSWPVERIGAATGSSLLWGAVYPFADSTGTGCVAFDKTRFSAEGDLVTYLRWLVEEIYLELPEDARRQWPALLLSSREVRLRVDKPGYKPLALAAKEGATLTFRREHSELIILLIPFVLDPSSGHVAIKVAYSDKPYWQGNEKHSLGFVIASPSQPAQLEDPAISIIVEGIAPASTP
jgi:hypothetical protein